MRYFIPLLFLIIISVVGCGPSIVLKPSYNLFSDSTPAPMKIITDPPGDSDGVLRLEYRKGLMTSYGSAFAVTYGGKDYICTAFHVLGNEDGVLSLFYDNHTPVSFTSNNIIMNPEMDFVIVAVENLPKNIKRWEIGEMSERDDIKVIGYANADKRTEAAGKVEKINFTSTAIIESGMSGGLVISNNKAVGIITHQVKQNNGIDKSLGAVLKSAFQNMAK